MTDGPGFITSVFLLDVFAVLVKKTLHNLEPKGTERRTGPGAVCTRGRNMIF